jgi:thermolysin
MANPAVFSDPDRYSKRYVGEDDNGGVHTNATIATHAFSWRSKGLNRTSGLAVQGVGARTASRWKKCSTEGSRS